MTLSHRPSGMSTPFLGGEATSNGSANCEPSRSPVSKIGEIYVTTACRLVARQSPS
jgi:hypothetical protein